MALAFDGLSDYVIASSDFALAGSWAATWWMQRSAGITPVTECLIGAAADGGHAWRVELVDHATYGKCLRCSFDGTGVVSGPSKGPAISEAAIADLPSGAGGAAPASREIYWPAAEEDNTWHHYAICYNEPGNAATLFVDGVIQPSLASIGASSVDTISVGFPLAIGALGREGTPDRWFAGSISDFSLFNAAITPAQIYALRDCRPGDAASCEVDLVNHVVLDTVTVDYQLEEWSVYGAVSTAGPSFGPPTSYSTPLASSWFVVNRSGENDRDPFPNFPPNYFPTLEEIPDYAKPYMEVR